MTRPAGIARVQARVLIVDDEARNRRVLEAMLAPEGLDLVSAGDGDEALALLAAGPPFDLILLDVMMPGMDGYDVARRVKQNPATTHIPIIMVTAHDTRDDRMLGLSAGAEDFLTKPIDRTELCLRVRNLLRLKAYGDYYDKYSQLLEGEVVTRTSDLVDQRNTLEAQAVVLTKQAALLDLAHDAIFVRDMRGRVMFWSRGAEAMYGWSREEAVGNNVAVLLDTRPDDAAGDSEATLLDQGRWEDETIHYQRDGTRLVVASRSAVQCDADGVPIRILTISSNITERKRAEAERVLLMERLSLATAIAKVGVWEWDLTSDTHMWDATMHAIYGIPPAGLSPAAVVPHAQWAAVVHPDDLPGVEAGLRDAVARKCDATFEFRITRADGTTGVVTAVTRVVLDDRGTVIRVIGADMDVTARRAVAAAVEQHARDQLRFKDEFLSHVSHELRSPLTAIKQFTTILLGGLAGPITAEQKQYQQIVLKNVQQLQAMIDDLLEVTRLETGKLTFAPDSVFIRDAVVDALDTLEGTARAKGITLSADAHPALPAAQADPTRLRQILIILLDNAVKFTPAGGSVEVRVGLLPHDPHSLLVEVHDTGCGIDPAITDRIFERLYQVAEPDRAGRKGLGLGLYICSELVKRQGGRIWARGLTPCGSVFSFTLPVFAPGALVPADATERPAAIAHLQPT